MEFFENTEFLILLIAALAFVIYGFFGIRGAKEKEATRLGWLRLSAGFSMSFIGGAATIAMAGIGYANGLIGLIDPIAVLLGGGLVAFWIAANRMPVSGQGVANFLASGQTMRTRIYTACSFSVYTLMASAQVVALAAIFAPHIGQNAASVLSICLLAGTSLYILFGGIAAVTKTDVVQFSVVAILFFLPAIFGILSIDAVVGSSRAITQTDLDTRTILLLSLSFLFVPLSQDVWVRVRSAKSPASAQMGILLGAIFYMLIVGAAVVLGYQSARAGLVVTDPEQVLPVFFSSQLGMTGILSTVVILAAVLSTLDSFTYNLNSTISDFDQKNDARGKGISLKEICIAVIVFLIVSVIATMAQSILGLVLTALMIYVSVIGPGFVLSRYAKNEITLWLPALITLTAIVGCSIIQVQLPYEPYSFLALHIAMIAVMIIIEKFQKKDKF